MAKSPVMEDSGPKRDMQQQRHKEIRFMSHVREWPHRETSQKSLRGKYWITGSVISHSPLIASCALSASLSHAQRRKTQTFLSPPPGEQVNGPLMLRSEDQSQQGSHVCPIKTRGWAVLTWEPQCMQVLLDRTRNNSETEEGWINVRKMRPKPRNSVQRRGLKK